AGLLVVAASINMSRIIKTPSVVSRLAGTLVSFGAVLVVASLIIVPGQSNVMLGAEIAVVGALATAFVALLNGVRAAAPQSRRSAVWMVALGALANGLVALAGVFLTDGIAGGLYWLVPGTLLAFTVGLGNAWVALVEILR